MLSGKTTLIAHIGYPTEAFKAPLIYNPWFEKHGIDAMVVPMGVKPEDYASVLKSVFQLTNVPGALVTMPHKVTTLNLADEVSVTARIAGAANALLKRADGSLLADQFDGAGYARGVARKGFQTRGSRILIVGTGGVGEVRGQRPVGDRRADDVGAAVQVEQHPVRDARPRDHLVGGHTAQRAVLDVGAAGEQREAHHRVDHATLLPRAQPGAEDRLDDPADQLTGDRHGDGHPCGHVRIQPRPRPRDRRPSPTLIPCCTRSSTPSYRPSPGRSGDRRWRASRTCRRPVR